MTTETGIVPAEPEEEEDMASWSSEPRELQGLMDSYVVECRFPGRQPGTSLFLVHAVRRNSESVAMVPNQKFKLFLVPGLESSRVRFMCLNGLFQGI